MRVVSRFLWGILVSCSFTASAFALKVGVTSGPHAMIMEQVKREAAKEGFNIQIVEFNDFILPNEALNEGEIDVNSYQHEPFLKEQIKQKGYKLVNVGKTVLMPMGIYSSQLKSLTEIKTGCKVAIPNDPTNGGRALRLLETKGMLTLKPDVDLPSILDITDNPKNLKIIEIDAPQLPRSLEDVSIAVINTDWVVLAKMDPQKALVMESKDSPYANILVVREVDKDKDDLQKFIEFYHLPTIKSYIEENFQGAVVPMW